MRASAAFVPSITNAQAAKRYFFMNCPSDFWRGRRSIGVIHIAGLAHAFNEELDLDAAGLFEGQRRRALFALPVLPLEADEHQVVAAWLERDVGSSRAPGP